jgi:hypothetical protein
MINRTTNLLLICQHNISIMYTVHHVLTATCFSPFLANISLIQLFLRSSFSLSASLHSLTNVYRMGVFIFSFYDLCNASCIR